MSFSWIGFTRALVTGVVVTTAASTIGACASQDDDTAAANDELNVRDILGISFPTTFRCGFVSGDPTLVGAEYKLAVGKGSATFEATTKTRSSEDRTKAAEEFVTKFTGKLAKALPSAPAGTDRYLINGIADDAVTSVTVPHSVPFHGLFGIGIAVANGSGSSVTTFGCVDTEADARPPGMFREAGPSKTSGVEGTVAVTCAIADKQAGFPETLAVTLSAKSVSVKGSGGSGKALEGNGPFDVFYKPKTDTAFVRYLVDGLVDDASTDVIVEKPVLQGNAGTVKIEVAGAAFQSVAYACPSK